MKALKVLLFFLLFTSVSLAQDLGATTNLWTGNLSTYNPVGSSDSWSGRALIAYLPGNQLLVKPASSTTIKLVLAVVAGSTLDITDMAVAITNAGKLTATFVIPVKYGGIANPSINLTGIGGVCAGQTLSYQNPCFVQLDAVGPLSFQNNNDLYFGVFFTSDTNNQSILLSRSTRVDGIFTWFEATDVVSGWAINMPITGPDESKALANWGVHSVSR